MRKPYVSLLPANSCILGTVIWFDSDHGGGMPCRTFHPYTYDPKLAYCNNAGWTVTVTSYRQGWVYRRLLGTWINKKLYMPGEQLQVVIGAIAGAGV